MIKEITYVSKSFLIRRKSFWQSKKYDVDKLTKDILPERQNEPLIPIKTLDLEKGSDQEISFCCDYCSQNEKVFVKISYKTYLKRRKIVAKDSCKKHAHLKAKEIEQEIFSKEEIENRQKQKSEKIKKIKNSYSTEKKEKINQKRKETNRLLGRPLHSFGTNPEKSLKTLQEKYGKYITNASQVSQIKEKKKETYKKYQHKCYTHLQETCLKQDKTLLLSFEDYLNKKYIQEGEMRVKCNTCNTEYFQSPFNIYRKSYLAFQKKCPICYPLQAGSSLIEQDFNKFLYSLLPKDKIKIRDRKILEGKEIDFFISEYNIGFEINGLYYHSENSGAKGENYHLNKFLKAKEKGINLYFIYDNEWMNKREIIESIVKSKLGIMQNRVYARNCAIQKIDVSSAKSFFNSNHIQGGEVLSSSDVLLGLFYEKELISCIALNKPRFNKKYQYELLRYANKLNTQVIGGFTKLLTAFERECNPKSIITYSDIRLFQNNTYEKAGFTFLTLTKPNYFYIKNGLFVGTRYKFQKHKLLKLLPVFDPTLTEWENMQNNGYDRVWDCGNRVFEKKYI